MKPKRKQVSGQEQRLLQSKIDRLRCSIHSYCNKIKKMRAEEQELLAKLNELKERTSNKRENVINETKTTT